MSYKKKQVKEWKKIAILRIQYESLLAEMERSEERLNVLIKLSPEVRQNPAGVCNYRMLIDGVYFGYIDGEWLKSSDQLLSKRRYEEGEKV